MKKIVWIADVPGWAYDNRAATAIVLLPDYEHQIVFNPIKNLATAIPVCIAADLIVCPDPRLLPFLPLHEKTVLHLNAVKLF